jgi:DNA polymerase III delta prime subunit
VNNLTVYEKNIKLKSIGLRWSFTEKYDNINSFIITLTNKKIDFEKQITVEPKKMYLLAKILLYYFRKLNTQ